MSAPRIRPVTISATPSFLRTAPDPPQITQGGMAHYRTGSGTPARNTTAPSGSHDDHPHRTTSRNVVVSPSSIPRAPSTRPLPHQSAPASPLVHLVAPPSEHQGTERLPASGRPQINYVAPPPNLRSQIRQSPNFPFRDVEFVEALFELEHCTVPYTWYMQSANTNARAEFEQSIRANVLGLLARRVPLLLRDLWTEVHPGIASSLRFDFSQGKATVVSARWPMRVYIAVRSTSSVPCSLLVHAMEDLVASRPALTEPVELLEKYLRRSVGNGELTLLDVDAYATFVEETEQA